MIIPVLATPCVRANMRRELAMLHIAVTQTSTTLLSVIVMLSQLKRCAKNLLSRPSAAPNELLRRLTKRARPNLVTGIWADLPRSRAELSAKNALFRFQSGAAAHLHLRAGASVRG